MLFASLTDVAEVLRRLHQARTEGSEFAPLTDISEAIELATQFEYVLGRIDKETESIEEHAARLWSAHQYGAHTLAILELCAAAEFYLKDIFRWVLHRRPELLAAAAPEVRPSAKSLATSQTLEEVRSQFANIIVSTVVKGERWREKTRNVGKFLGLSIDGLHPAGMSFLEEFFRARNGIMHMKSSEDFDLTFGDYKLVITPQADRATQIANSRGLSNVIRVSCEAIAHLDHQIAVKHLSRPDETATE